MVIEKVNLTEGLMKNNVDPVEMAHHQVACPTEIGTDCSSRVFSLISQFNKD